MRRGEKKDGRSPDAPPLKVFPLLLDFFCCFRDLFKALSEILFFFLDVPRRIAFCLFERALFTDLSDFRVYFLFAIILNTYIFFLSRT